MDRVFSEIRAKLVITYILVGLAITNTSLNQFLDTYVLRTS